MWRVQLYVGGREVAAYDLPCGRELVVGRDPAADVVVGERSVSRRHCRLSGTSQGVEVADMGSANGVYVAGKQITTATLGAGQSLQIGMAHLRVSLADGRTGMISLDALREGASTTGSELPTSASSAESTRSVLDASRSAYKALEKDRLAFLIEAGKSLSQPLELDALFERIMDLLFQIFPVRRAVLVLREADGRLKARCIRPRTDIAELSEVASRSILQTVMESGRAQIIDDAQMDQGLNMAMSILAADIKAAICAPLTSHDRVIGALYADYPGRAQLYRQSDLDFFGAFASLCAVALDNARLQGEVRTRERLQRDLEIAAEIQMGLLPDDDLVAPGVELDWAYVPSKHVGGDFYDCTVLEGDRIALVLGDVSGKSIGAALFMARLMSFLRATVPEDPDPAVVLTRTNALLGTRSNQVMFATACFILLSPKDGWLRYASAGHNPAMLLNQGTDAFVSLDRTGIPLGVHAQYVYQEKEVPIAEGSLVVLYTDGIVEARNTEKEQFGLGALQAIVLSHRDRPVQEITRALNDAVSAWCRGSTFTRDDIAIMVVRVSGVG